MGLIDKLKRITLGRIEAFLDTVERPDQVLPQLIRDMQGRLKQAANAEAKGLAGVRGARRKLDELTGRLARLTRGAELAVQSRDDDLAARAIAAQLEAERSLPACRQAVDRAESAYQGAHDVRTRLQRDLSELKARKTELLARLRTVREREKTRDLADPLAAGGGDLLDAVARMEEKVARREDHVQARDEIARQLDRALLDDVPDQALRDAEVQRRLAALRQASESGPDSTSATS